MPRVSILVPVRDARPWLAGSLRSLERQTCRDFEIVAVDDGSTDGSGEWLERATEREPRLRVLHTPPRGLPSALNHALSNARAPFLARHDADDRSDPRRLSLQLEVFDRTDARTAVVGSRVRLFPVRAVGTGMRRWAAWHNALLTHEEMAREVLIDSPLAHGSALIRREPLEAVGGWAERGWPEDLDLWLRLLERGARFAKRREVLYAWRQHPASATRRDPRYSRASFLALKRDALSRGLLAHGRSCTLIGVGASLAAWQKTLGEGEGGLVRRSLEAARPSPAMLATLETPIVLVFGSVPARERWRTALLERGLAELRDFAFVA